MPAFHQGGAITELFPAELADIDLVSRLAHVGRCSVADVGVVCPAHGSRALSAPVHQMSEGVEHVSVAQVPGLCRAVVHGSIVSLRRRRGARSAPHRESCRDPALRTQAACRAGPAAPAAPDAHMWHSRWLAPRAHRSLDRATRGLDNRNAPSRPPPPQDRSELQGIRPPPRSKRSCCRCRARRTLRAQPDRAPRCGHAASRQNWRPLRCATSTAESGGTQDRCRHALPYAGHSDRSAPRRANPPRLPQY